jgi:hypothetical protein
MGMAIHKLENGTCVISANDMWLPGTYENERAARLAFKLTDEQKAELRDRAIKKSDGVITCVDIEGYKNEQ